MTKKANPQAGKQNKDKSKNKGKVVKTRTKKLAMTQSYNTMVRSIDARDLTHLPPPFPMGPYTVLRSRRVFTVTTPTTPSTNAVFLIGPHRLGSVDSAITPLVGIWGTGVNVPGTTENNILDGLMVNYAGNNNTSTANGQLHAITVVVQCTSSATTAVGVVYSGALTQRVGRTNYATWNGLADALVARRELQSTSAYTSMTKPIAISGYPVDTLEWGMQYPVWSVDASSGNNYSTDTLSQIALVFPNTTTAVDYNITVHTEWRVNFTDTALSSTSIKRQPAGQGLWNSIIHAASDIGGRIDQVTHVASEVGAVANTFRQVSNYVGTLGSVMRPLANVI